MRARSGPWAIPVACSIEGKVLLWFDDRREKIGNHPLREQAFGESVDATLAARLTAKWLQAYR
jgi:hypothetical protein